MCLSSCLRGEAHTSDIIDLSAERDNGGLIRIDHMPEQWWYHYIPFQSTRIVLRPPPSCCICWRVLAQTRAHNHLTYGFEQGLAHPCGC